MKTWQGSGGFSLHGDVLIEIKETGAKKINRQKNGRSRGGVASKKMLAAMIDQTQEKTRPRIEHETFRA